RYIAMVNDLHAMQRRAVAVIPALNTLYPQMAGVKEKITASSSVPASVKTQFDALDKDLEIVRKKFGVPLPAPNAGGRGGGGGRGGAQVDPENVYARATALKTGLMAIWEAPSAASVRQYNEVKLGLPKATSDASALLSRAAAVSQALKKYDINLNVPAVSR